MKRTENIVIPYETLEITLTNGNKVEFGKDEWNDFRHSDKFIAVIDKHGCWRAIYRWDNVFSVELK